MPLAFVGGLSLEPYPAIPRAVISGRSLSIIAPWLITSNHFLKLIFTFTSMLSTILYTGMNNKDKNWHGLIKVLSVEHRSADGKILWQSKNLHNMLHSEGESFMLEVLFNGGIIPDNYFFGMDSRSSIDIADTMTDIDNVEPDSNGYYRAEVASSGEFVISETDGLYSATSPIISFEASGGHWSASNLFLTNENGYSGKLIASVPLGTTITVTSGQIVSVKMVLSLRDVNS